jgi:hypothetical protein
LEPHSIQGIRPEASHCAQISKNDRHKRTRAAKAHRDKTLGLAIACSLRVSLQGSGALASPDPTNQHYNQPPESRLGQAIRPRGSKTALVQLSKSSISHPRLQIAPETAGVLSATSRE